MLDLEPIFIASAVRRSGTTLIQRLLCSSDNCLIYGETCANDLNFFHQIFLGKQLSLGTSSDFRDDMLKEVLAGNVNDWIADIMPPIMEVIEVYKKSCFGFLSYLAEYAASQNRPLWGVKMAEWHSSHLLQVQKILPKSKLLYIHRNLEDCVRSAKGIEVIKTEQEIEQFCALWQQNYQAVKQHYPAELLLEIDYEKLLKEKTETIKQIEDFTGVSGIKEAVFGEKINTYKFDERQAEGVKSGYLDPKTLTDEEIEIIRKYENLV